MDTAIDVIAAKYRAKQNSSTTIKDEVTDLYTHYIKSREKSLIDAVATAAAVNALYLSDEIDMSKVTPQMEEAFRLAYPNEDLASLADRAPTEIQGFIPAWKGKYFEVLVRDNLNRGEYVGDIHLSHGQTAVISESATQPGWDIQIIEADGSVVQELQLKATQSFSYVKEALERYPDIDVLTPDEVLQFGGAGAESILASGFSESDLEDSILAPVEALLDSPFEELFETTLPGLPFVLIAVGEGRKVLMGRKTFEIAMRDGLSRSVKTGTAIGVGASVVFLGGGLLSIPAIILTRLGSERIATAQRIEITLEQRIQELRSLSPSSQ